MAKNYKGFTIRKGKDCWGCEVWTVYKDGERYSDCMDCETEAIEWINDYLGE